MSVIGVSLSKPRIDHDNSPHVRNNGMSECITYPAFVALWFLRSCMPWNASHIPVYWHTHMYDLQLHLLNSKDDKNALLWKFSTKTGGWMRRHMVYTDSAYWDTDSGAVAAWQLANMPLWLKNDPQWAAGLYCLVFSNVHIDIGMTLNLLLCLCVICGCRAVQTNITSAERSLALQYKISSGSPPVFLECTS